PPNPESGAARTILVGDAESWQRQWALWQRIRHEGEMLILAESAGELRAFTGSRELPPYAELHMGRAWSIHAGRAHRRVSIPSLDPTARWAGRRSQMPAAGRIIPTPAPPPRTVSGSAAASSETLASLSAPARASSVAATTVAA